MSDQFPIVPPQVTASAGVVSDYVINLAFNQLTIAVRTALNTLAAGTPPIGPAGGDLSGAYPNPTVAKVHATSGTIDNVVIGGLVPAAGTFTTVAATTVGPLTNPLSVPNGGTGVNSVPLNGVVIGQGGAALSATTVGTTGQMLIGVTGAAPVFGNNPTITGGTINNTSVGATTPSTGAFTTLTATTPVAVTSGGTGVGSVTNNGVVIGKGTAALSATAAGSNGQMLLGVTGGAPAFGNNPTITGGTIDNAAIGGTTRAAGNFTTVSATGAITPSTTAGIVGTTLADSANAGSVGEYNTATGVGVSLTTATPANIANVVLTAGDYDVWGNIEFDAAGSTVIQSVTASISNTSATQAASPDRAILTGLTFTAGSAASLVAPMTRINVSASTTIYLVGTCSFTTSTLTATGRIGWRRRR